MATCTEQEAARIEAITARVDSLTAQIGDLVEQLKRERIAKHPLRGHALLVEAQRQQAESEELLQRVRAATRPRPRLTLIQGGHDGQA